MRIAVLKRRKFILNGAVVLAAIVGVVISGGRRPSVEVRVLRIQKMEGFQYIYDGYNDHPYDDRAVVLEVRNAGPGLLWFDGKHKIMVKCGDDWLMPTWPSIHEKRPFMELHDHSTRQFLVYVYPETETLLTLDYEHYGLLDQAHLFAMGGRFPKLDRQIFLPLLRLYLTHFGRETQRITTEVTLR